MTEPESGEEALSPRVVAQRRRRAREAGEREKAFQGFPGKKAGRPRTTLGAMRIRREWERIQQEREQRRQTT